MVNTGALIRIEEIISQIAEGEGYKNFRLETKAITSDGANFMGDLYLVDIYDLEDSKETLNLFVKAANTSEQARAVVSANKAYQTEVFMYTTVAETFNVLQEKHSVPEENKFKFPKYYGSILIEMEEVIVLENLAVKGYELFDRLKPFDWEYAKTAAEEIAKFHALSFALEKENYDFYEKHLKVKRNIFADSMEVMKESIKPRLYLALSVVDPENHGRIRTFIEDNGLEMFSSLMTPPKYSVLTHGDYRMSNIMVKYKDSRVVSMKPIDYQTVGMGCPVADLLYFLFSGSDEAFRRQHYENFFLHYHDTLAVQLKLLSQDVDEVYPRSAFYNDLNDNLVFGLEVALSMLNLILIDPNDVLTVDDMLKGMTSSATDINKPNEEYAKRINGVVRDYVRWGFLKKEDNSEFKFTPATENTFKS